MGSRRRRKEDCIARLEAEEITLRTPRRRGRGPGGQDSSNSEEILALPAIMTTIIAEPRPPLDAKEVIRAGGIQIILGHDLRAISLCFSSRIARIRKDSGRWRVRGTLSIYDTGTLKYPLSHGMQKGANSGLSLRIIRLQITQFLCVSAMNS